MTANPLLALEQTWRDRADHLTLESGEATTRCADELAAALSQSDGWVMVPREPTAEMVDAGVAADTNCIESYKAMLAAAPAAQSQGNAELIAAGRKLLAAMDMQEKRETGEFHISQATAKHMWDEAKAAWASTVCSTCEPNGIYATDGTGPFDCYACGKKATPPAGDVEALDSIVTKAVDDLSRYSGPAKSFAPKDQVVSMFSAERALRGSADEFARHLASAPHATAGDWFCESHPWELMGHNGCDGAGLPECARWPMAKNIVRLLKQRIRELRFQYGFLAEQAATAPAVVVDEAMVERYCTAVHEHLGSLREKQSATERDDCDAAIRRIARIGLTAALGQGVGK